MLVNTLIEVNFMRKRNNLKIIIRRIKKTYRIHLCLQIIKDGIFFLLLSCQGVIDRNLIF